MVQEKEPPSVVTEEPVLNEDLIKRLEEVKTAVRDMPTNTFDGLSVEVEEVVGEPAKSLQYYYAIKNRVRIQTIC